MTCYRIFRMKETERQRFRSQPHTAGTSIARPKDYEESGVVEADSPYAAWNQMKDGEAPLRIGDILVARNESVTIFKYIGVEEAQWFVPAPPAHRGADPMVAASVLETAAAAG